MATRAGGDVVGLVGEMGQVFMSPPIVNDDVSVKSEKEGFILEHQ